MVKAKEIKHMEPDDAALDEIGESRFSEIVSSLGRRSEWRNGQRM
jgi:hypothetical protein